MRFVPFFLAISLWTGNIFAQAVPSMAIRTVKLAVVGLASSETAQVNVVNLATSVAAVVTGGSLPAGGVTATCTGGITFYNTNGNSITSATFTIGSGQIFSAPLPYSYFVPGDPPPTGIGRTAVWATVTINEPDSSTAPCQLGSNIETFDTATGVTHVHVEGGTVALPNVFSFLGPQPSPR
jgi:hypothetical protein